MKFLISSLIMISLIFTGFKPVVFDGDYTENDNSTYFEEVYENDGETCMDIYMHADCVGKGNLHTDFSRNK